MNKRQEKSAAKQELRPFIQGSVEDNVEISTLKPIDTTTMGEQKRRGRKRERDDVYFVKAVNKIKEIREILKTAKKDGLTVKQRQKLRN